MLKDSFSLISFENISVLNSYLNTQVYNHKIEVKFQLHVHKNVGLNQPIIMGV